MNTFIKYALYPLLLAATLGAYFLAPHFHWELAAVFGALGGIRMVILLTVEFLHPAKPEWKMTWASFRRDLKWMATGGAVFGLLKLSVGMLAINYSKLNTGILANTNIFTELLVIGLVYEFFQYWYHRLSHEGKGAFGAWLWRVHVAHHLPDRLYLLMHPVFHPLNFLLTNLIIQAPLVLLGARPETLFLFNAIMGLQGLVSHFNVDIRAGWLNYIFVGTELHRNHHSADMTEAKNYGSVLSIWDLVFGTFRYTPGKLPVRLGVEDVDAYPHSTELLKVLALPFQAPAKKRV